MTAPHGFARLRPAEHHFQYAPRAESVFPNLLENAMMRLVERYEDDGTRVESGFEDDHAAPLSHFQAAVLLAGAAVSVGTLVFIAILAVIVLS